MSKFKSLPNTVVHTPTKKDFDELMQIYEDAGWFSVGAKEPTSLAWSMVYSYISAENMFSRYAVEGVRNTEKRIITLKQFKQEQGLMKKELKDMHDTTEVDLSTRKIVDDLRSAAILGVDVTYEVLADYIRTKAMQIARVMANEPTPKKLTKSEIEEKLGYSVEIVED